MFVKTCFLAILIVGGCGDNIVPGGPPSADADLTGPEGPVGPQGPRGTPGTCACPVSVVTEACAANNHAVWFAKDLGRDYVFAHEPMLVDRHNGVADLTGIVTSKADPGRAWRLKVQFSGATKTPPAQSPKNPPGCADTSDWTYYPDVSGSMEGLGFYAGTVIVLTRRGPAAQRGQGASLQSCGQGLSTWFNYETLTQWGGAVPWESHGDINIALGADCVEDNNAGTD